MRCLPGSNDCALPYYYRKPYAATIPPPIFIESNACFNCNVKLTPAAAEWSETMPRLPAERLHVSRKGIPKHCLVRRAYRAEYVRSRSRNRETGICPDSTGSPGVRGSAPGVKPDVRSACPLCPSPSVARVRSSRGCQGRPAGRAQRPLTPSAIILDPTDGGRAFLPAPRRRKRGRQRPPLPFSLRLAPARDVN